MIYQSSNGIRIEVTKHNRLSYSYRFVSSNLCFGNFRSCFDAILHASWKNKKSMKTMDWAPERDILK